MQEPIQPPEPPETGRPESGLLKTLPPPTEPPPEGPSIPWARRVRTGLLGQLEKRGVGRTTLGIAALVPAGLGALLLVIDHPGWGAIAGLLALGAGWLATTPPETPDAALDAPDETPGASGGAAIAALCAHVSMPLLLGGAVMAAAADGAPAQAGLAAWVAFVLLLLPLLRALSAPGALTESPLLWSSSERTLALLAGMLLGHVGLTLFVTALVATTDLVLRLALLFPRPPERPPLTGPLRRLFGTRGEPQPGVRLACGLALALLVVLCVALGATDDWRF